MNCLEVREGLKVGKRYTHSRLSKHMGNTAYIAFSFADRGVAKYEINGSKTESAGQWRPLQRDWFTDEWKEYMG